MSAGSERSASPLVAKRSITIRGHRTSVSVEDAFWDRLQVLAAERALSVAALVASIDAARDADTNLSSAIRLHVLNDALSRIGETELPTIRNRVDC